MRIGTLLSISASGLAGILFSSCAPTVDLNKSEKTPLKITSIRKERMDTAGTTYTVTIENNTNNTCSLICVVYKGDLSRYQNETCNRMNVPPMGVVNMSIFLSHWFTLAYSTPQNLQSVIAYCVTNPVYRK
ncbi:hypothetical protein SAMN06265353_1320 [Hydrogenobacter hydrogenophilus]|uniref:Lipoprotein n=1 Tax=Hydrogenobacter hydrogenophilus TaxID=35835 RepID=A0A285P5Q4_9AQUI|nr:hypothetical protein SAMN06265353_1320 [Hydrogenobacter hydrogenophilus]